MEGKITIGDKYGPAMKITEQVAADAYFEECVAHTMSFGKSRQEAEEIERSNLGYFAGYCSDETRQRVERLFKCAHPIFGRIDETGPVSTEQALQAGFDAARAKSGQNPVQKIEQSKNSTKSSRPLSSDG